ncbi:30S ribosomal protein S20 [Yaniella flava]|uniref:Small ribosomal subunit protein bS20 n=1 Tax=Yaniella flava TaxID=287930 RepID=A0ABN2UEV7_9MICC|nr:30S ribosomal protein S20 [Micrococcaceae bacterium]
MANLKSSKKRAITNEKRRERNTAIKSEAKTLLRKVNKAVQAGDKEAAQKALSVANRKLDKAVSKGAIHRNNAANRKSGAAARVNAMDA